jgi:hypothetical protein
MVMDWKMFLFAVLQTRQDNYIFKHQMDTFVKSRKKDFERFADFEDVTALFFDCDGDGDT